MKKELRNSALNKIEKLPFMGRFTRVNHYEDWVEDSLQQRLKAMTGRIAIIGEFATGHTGADATSLDRAHELLDVHRLTHSDAAVGIGSLVAADSPKRTRMRLSENLLKWSIEDRGVEVLHYDDPGLIAEHKDIYEQKENTYLALDRLVRDFYDDTAGVSATDRSLLVVVNPYLASRVFKNFRPSDITGGRLVTLCSVGDDPLNNIWTNRWGTPNFSGFSPADKPLA